jgi:hypothetical protein
MTVRRDDEVLNFNSKFEGFCLLSRQAVFVPTTTSGFGSGQLPWAFFLLRSRFRDTNSLKEEIS